MKMKINMPDELVEKMALFPDIDFNKMAIEVIEKYVNENEPRMTFEQKEARRALQTWRERV
jgi:hypothetical protein